MAKQATSTLYISDQGKYRSSSRAQKVKGNVIGIPCTLVISDAGESYLTQPPSLGCRVFLFFMAKQAISTLYISDQGKYHSSSKARGRKGNVIGIPCTLVFSDTGEA